MGILQGNSKSVAIFKLLIHTTKLNVNSRYRRARTSKASKTSAERRRSIQGAPRTERAMSSDLVYALYLRPEWLALTCRLETSIPALPSRRKTLHSGRTLTTNGLSMGHQETHLFRYAFIEFWVQSLYIIMIINYIQSYLDYH